MSVWMSLPVETWLEISHLVRSSSLQDLADLCLTCSQLMCIARPILYCDVTLMSTAEVEPNLAAAATFSLLARDEDLARSVRKLTLDAAEDQELDINQTPILVHIASLKNMTQLKSLTATGAIFRYADEDLKAEFIETLSGLPLEEINFPCPGDCFYHFSEDQFAKIANLKSIACYSENDEHEYFGPRCLRLLSMSTSSLTSLSLWVTYIGDWSDEVFAMRFPLLRSLTIDIWDEGMHTPSGFDDFLLAHHENLEHLDMGHTPCAAVLPAALIFGADLLRPNLLPNLRSFKGHCQNVEMMAQAGMRCLTDTLTKLGVGLIEDPQRAVNQMFDALQARGCMGALKELDFDLFQWQDDEREAIPVFIFRCGEICGPSLETWKGLIPFIWTWTPEELAGFFSAFPKLRVIWFANDPLVFGPPQMRGDEEGEEGEGEEDESEEPRDFEDYFRVLAEKCGSLEEVWVTWGHKKSYWMIERGPGSRIVIRGGDED
ncbi:hypothetical protein B0H17DRAFT_1052851 [Mycena rosella]|uniref:F-box domain-containing protein n=1 Tax=Mycena rosella TaxID=1033263 RepID=A0AAD7GIT6_MYCRO|nr:hypothetical protein B0H17DRAFT_1052851 [Mycena rosella]